MWDLCGGGGGGNGESVTEDARGGAKVTEKAGGLSVGVPGDGEWASFCEYEALSGVALGRVGRSRRGLGPPGAAD